MENQPIQPNAPAMQPVTAGIKTQMVVTICFLFCIGVGLYCIHIFTNYHGLGDTVEKGLGIFLASVSVLSVFSLKKVTIDLNGIRLDYVTTGRTKYFRHDEIYTVVARMNNQRAGLVNLLAGNRYHLITITPMGARKFIVTSSNSTHFMEFYNALLWVYRERMQVTDKQGAMF